MALGLEHGLYELPLPAGPHPLLGGLLYPEPPWSPAAPCSPPRKAPAEPLRPLYPGGAEPVPGGGGSEEPGGHLPAGFAPFFPECPLPPPQPSYDYGGGYHRGGYPGLRNRGHGPRRIHPWALPVSSSCGLGDAANKT
ncbi:hypothetical protein Nmel_002834 [Mimus melanotis]